MYNQWSSQPLHYMTLTNLALNLNICCSFIYSCVPCQGLLILLLFMVSLEFILVNFKGRPCLPLKPFGGC